MRLLKILILLVLSGCSSQDRYGVFEKKNFDNVTQVSLDSIFTINEFESVYQELYIQNKSELLSFGFDYELGNFNDFESKVICIGGQQPEAAYPKYRNILRLYFNANDALETSTGKEISEEDLSAIYKQHLLNFGYDPALPESISQTIVWLVFEEKHALHSSDKYLKILADAYLSVIDSLGEYSSDLSSNKFPIQITFKKLVPPPSLPKEIYDFEIDSMVKSEIN